MGIDIDANKNYGLSLALGTAEASLVQMTNAYAAFANQGQQYNTTVIKQVNNKYDQSIFQSEEKSKEVISPQGAYLISSILSDYNARAPIFGYSLSVPGHTAAVKTGTTDDSRDAWTIGYTPQLAVGVWVGNNNNAVMQNGGSGMAGPIWVNTMQAALRNVKDTKFTIPAGVIQKPVCYGTGGLASSSGTNTYNEYFLASALPTTTCNATQKTVKPESDKTKKSDTDKKKDTTNTDTSGGDGTSDGTDTGTGDTGDGTDPGTGDDGTGTDTGTGDPGVVIPPVTP
jgi:penicillin-binding protein 1A